MKALKIVSLVLSSIIITIAVDQYFFCPVYTFEKAVPFSGDSIYNPYASAVTGNAIFIRMHIAGTGLPMVKDLLMTLAMLTTGLVTIYMQSQTTSALIPRSNTHLTT